MSFAAQNLLAPSLYPQPQPVGPRPIPYEQPGHPTLDLWLDAAGRPSATTARSQQRMTYDEVIRQMLQNPDVEAWLSDPNLDPQLRAAVLMRTTANAGAIPATGTAPMPSTSLPGMTAASTPLSQVPRDTEGRSTPAATPGYAQEIPYEGAEGAQPRNLALPAATPAAAPAAPAAAGGLPGYPGGGSPVGPAGSVTEGGGAAAAPAAAYALGSNLHGWDPMLGEGFSIGQNDFASKNPDAGLRMLLLKQGINPDSGIGQMMMQKANDIRVAYDLFAGQTGSAAEDPNLLLAFTKGWTDMYRSKDSGAAYAQQAQIRGVNRGQMQVGFTDPTSQIGQSMRFIMHGDGNTAGQGPDALWSGVIQPLARAAGATSMYLVGKRGQYQKHYRDWEQQQMAAAANSSATTEDFVSYLGRVGFKV